MLALVQSIIEIIPDCPAFKIKKKVYNHSEF